MNKSLTALISTGILTNSTGLPESPRTDLTKATSGNCHARS
ncbi:hypothetical protein [Anabaena sp. AL09]|nr:hypothetical protein [Anabaena sp. AL09]